ncbi:MAG: hypothetical protein ACE3JQ_03520 [Paenisporosarcina sp.]
MTNEYQQAKIVYTIVEREIDFYYQMQKYETHHELIVTPQTVTTAKKEFPIQDVIDFSYKPFSSEAGILYLHTNQGVFPFNIHSNPQALIETFRTFK